MAPSTKTPMTSSPPKPKSSDHLHLLDIPAVAHRLDVCDKTVRRLIACGDLSAHRIGRQLRISEKDFKRFLDARHEK